MIAGRAIVQQQPTPTRTLLSTYTFFCIYFLQATVQQQLQQLNEGGGGSPHATNATKQAALEAVEADHSA